MTQAPKPRHASKDGLRNAERSDERELFRLFYAMQAESGFHDFNIEKVRAMFDRGIRRDRAMLVVTGKPGRLKGMVLFATADVWFSDAQRMTEMLFFVDPGARRSANARPLRKLVEQCRKINLEIERPPAGNEPAKPDLFPNGQECTAPDETATLSTPEKLNGSMKLATAAASVTPGPA